MARYQLPSASSHSYSRLAILRLLLLDALGESVLIYGDADGLELVAGYALADKLVGEVAVRDDVPVHLRLIEQRNAGVVSHDEDCRDALSPAASDAGDGFSGEQMYADDHIAHA